MNRLTVLLLSVFVLAALGGLFSCRTDPTGPKEPPPPLPSSSQTVFIDTLVIESSVIYDVAIVDDTLVYAVGEMYKRDSTGQFETVPYGLAIWNGRTWKLKRIYALYPLQNLTPIRPTGVFAFSATDVWFAWYDVFHWNGNDSMLTLHPVRAVLGNGQGLNKL